MPLPDDVHLHAEQRRRVLDSLAVVLGTIWQGVNIDDEPRYLTAVLPPVNATLAAQTSIASAWVATRTGDAPRAAAVPYTRLRGGKAQTEVYRRPLLEVRKQLAAGVEYGRARDVAGRRLAVIAQTDAQSAYSQTMFDLLRRRRTVKRYRRAVSGANACSRCVTAAGQTLSTDQILPRHPSCRCSIVPLLGDDDPGLLIAGGADAPQIDVATVTHDELGPTLVDAAHDFTPMGTL